MLKRFFLFSMIFACINVSAAWAGGCLPGEPCDEKQPVVANTDTPEPQAVVMSDDSDDPFCCWGNRLAAGVPVWFFQEEDTEVGGGLYWDTFTCNGPLNLRVGVEVSHVKFDQPNALNLAEAPGRKTEVTFVRIPLAAEYMYRASDSFSLFVGGGPDLIRTANDVSDFTVGMHLSGRALYEFTDHMGIGVEAGYMWGEVEDNGSGDIDLDNTFISSTLSYRF